MNTPNGQSIWDRVQYVIAEQVGLESHEVTLESRYSDWPIDSLEEVEIIIALEVEFDLDIADEDAEKWNGRVKDIVAYIEERRGPA